MRAPVSVCLIVKNEPALEACLACFRDHVEEIVVVDTGSSDNTPEIAKKYADIFESYNECNNKETGLIEDFSMARQHAFSLSTQPFVMWADGDDFVVGAENLASLTAAADPDTYFMFPYETGYDSNGICTFRYYRERLFPGKNSCHWGGAVHEVLCSDNPNAKQVKSDAVVFQHRKKCHTKVDEPGRNFRIMCAYYDKMNGNVDARQLYYLGRECCDNGKLDDAIKHLTRYLEISYWEDEQVMACLKLVDIYAGQGKYEEALKWGFKTIQIKENWCEGYLAIGRMYYFMAMNGINEYRNWEKSVHFIKVGLSLPPTDTVLFLNPMERECDIHRYYNLALNKIGKTKEALESVLTGMKKRPDDPMFLQNKKVYEDSLGITAQNTYIW